MSSHTFIDCNGLAGFMSLGFVQAGMEMQSRTGTLNFGNPVAEVNRHHLGNSWNSFFSDDLSSTTPSCKIKFPESQFHAKQNLTNTSCFIFNSCLWSLV
jgi:hypothetical protein